MLTRLNYAPLTIQTSDILPDYCTGNTQEIDTTFVFRCDSKLQLRSFIPNVGEGDTIMSVYYGSSVVPQNYVDADPQEAVLYSFAPDPSNYCYPSDYYYVVGEVGGRSICSLHLADLWFQNFV